MDVEQSAGIFALKNDGDQTTKQRAPSVDEVRSIRHGENDLLGMEKVNEVLAAKMLIINDVSP